MQTYEQPRALTTNFSAEKELKREVFGEDFIWGIATAAYQIEGAVHADGRKDCIWDVFARKKGKIKNGHVATQACDFYHRYEEDLDLVKSMGFNHFRFSISWSRILPDGFGTVNQPGIDFYNKLIDRCLSLGIEPWITVYHWDLPQALEALGGWKNRQIIDWFSNYTSICANAFGDRVSNWIIINEPMAVAGLGYTTGLHAPGKKGIWNFLPVVHHLTMCQAEGARIVRAHVPKARIGLALSCSHVEAFSGKVADVRAAKRADAVMNRLFIEPALGLGYPVDAFSYLGNINKYIMAGDREKMQFDFDFVGIQNYFSVVVRHSYWAPVVWLEEVSAKERNMPVTGMGWAIDAEGLYKILKQFSRYEGVNSIFVSENGAAFEDVPEAENIADQDRVKFYKDYLTAVARAKEEGVPVNGYLAWTLMDNFEWAEGYNARFGLVYVDFASQKRLLKESGKWFRDFLTDNSDRATQ